MKTQCINCDLLLDEQCQHLLCKECGMGAGKDPEQEDENQGDGECPFC